MFQLQQILLNRKCKKEVQEYDFDEEFVELAANFGKSKKEKTFKPSDADPGGEQVVQHEETQADTWQDADMLRK